MKQLTKRLRDACTNTDICSEAADAIELMTSEIGVLNNAVVIATGALQRIGSERDALQIQLNMKNVEIDLMKVAVRAAPTTIADVLDALNVFNRPKPSEDDGPWEAGHFIRVDHLPDLINHIIAAAMLDIDQAAVGDTK